MPDPNLIQFEAHRIDVQMADDGGTAILGMVTDKGHIVVGVPRLVLQRLFEQTKRELERVPAPLRRRSDD
jgi:hypothetical protein